MTVVSMHPTHLEDLQRSMLSEETIQLASIKSVIPNRINKCLGFNMPGLISCYEIPYPGCDDFARYRCFYEEGKIGPKYLQKKNTGTHIYVPYSFPVSILNDSSLPLYIGEGEKKALKGCQEGIPCVALGGLWGWSDGNGELISDFNKIDLKGRAVFIVPDNDWKQANRHGYEKNLQTAVSRLANKLQERGAIVSIVELPKGPAKGLDDYLCQHTAEDFAKLPKKDVKMAKIKERKNKPQAVLRAIIPDLVDIIDDNGVPAFLISRNGKLEIRRVIEDISPNGEKIIIQPPGLEHLPFALVPAADVQKYINDIDESLFDSVLTHLKANAYLMDEQWLICTIYVFLTYLHDHPDIQYIPMLLFYAVPERGKTRTGKSLTYISYRGIHCVDLRETNLFRYAQELRATLFLDITDIWKTAERNQSQDVLLLRYEKGATVARVLYPEKGAFRDMKYYQVYGPTIMASNEPIHKILDTRCITFQMPNKPGHYNNPTPKQGMPLKARLTAWRARYMTAPLPEVFPIEGIQGRLWDICQPLFQICQIVAPEKYDALVEAVLNIATDRIQEKQSSDDGRLVQIMIELSPDDLIEWDITTKSITEEFNKGRPSGREKTPQAIGRRIRALGVRTKIVGGSSRAFLNREVMSTLGEQYGLLTRSESHDNHEYAKRPYVKGKSLHDIQHDFQDGELKSSPKSYSQDINVIKQKDMHDIHDIPYGVKETIPVTEIINEGEGPS